MQPSSFTPDEMNNLKLQYDAYKTTQQPSKKKAIAPAKRKGPGGAKGLIQGLLPIAGGALGAIAGIPLGPAGIIAGGAAGAGGGELLKQKLQGGPIDKGDVAQEALFGAIPGVGSGLKAIRAGAKVSELVKGGMAERVAADAALPHPVPKPSTATRIYNKGVITEARSGGFGQGEKVIPGKTQGFRDSEKIAKALNEEGITGGSASTRQIAAGDRLEQHGKTIAAAIDAKNTPVSEPHIANILDRVQSKILGENGKGVTGFVVGNKSHVDIADSYARQLAGVKDAKGLWSFKKALDNDAINYGRNSASPDPVKEQIARTFRTEVNKDFGNLVPEAKAASEAYSKLHSANELLKQAARDASNSATQTGGGVVGRVLTSDTATAVKSKAGRGMQTLGKLMGAKTGEVTPSLATSAPGTASNLLANYTTGNIAKKTTEQAGVRALAPVFSPTGPEQTQDTTDPLAAGGATGVTDITAPVTNDTQPMQSQYPQENLLADIQRDPKNANTYMTIYKQIQSDEQAQNKGGANISKVTAQQYGLAQRGVQGLDKLKGLLQSDPGVITRSATPGRGLPIVGGFISNKAGTGSYDAIGYSIADAALRLSTGAAATPSEVKDLQSKLMPRAGDSSETIATKLQTIEQIFSNPINLANNGGGMAADVSDVQAQTGL